MKDNTITDTVHCLLLAAILLGSGCAATGITGQQDVDVIALTPANTGNFGPRPAIPTPADLHRLTPEQQRHFLAYMNRPSLSTMAPNLRLYQYLDDVTSDYAYEGVTYNASDTLHLNSGNCMSLAVLTTALADLAGIEVGYELMDDIPVYEFNDTLVKKGVHIRTKLFEGELIEVAGVYLFTRPGIIIDYFPTNRQRFMGNINREEYLAMLYQNLAAEALERGDLDAAYWHALESLKHVPDHAAAMNTLAITNRRAGDLETAEFIYRFAIAHADDKLTLMKNYALLLIDSGHEAQARDIQDRLDAMEDPSPFHWYQLAKSAADNGDHRAAIRFYNKALDLAPYLHEAWLGIAVANIELGRLDRTRRALLEAAQEAVKVSTRNLYQAKLAALGRESTY